MMLTVEPKGIPDELTQCAQWVLWKSVERDGQVTKLPYQANGKMAKSNDPETWCDFETAIRRYSLGSWSGIGFVFSHDDPYCGIDLDGCRDPETGTVADWAGEIILAMSSYAEVSPSGTGVKIWVKGNWPFDGNKHLLEGVEKSSDKTPAIEVYDELRYFAVTGRVLQDQHAIRDCQENLTALREKYWKSVAAPVTFDFRSNDAVLERARRYLAKLPVAVSRQNGHGATFHAACVLVIGFELSNSDAMVLLREWNQGCQPPWSEHELQHKVDDAERQSGERGYLRNVSPNNFDRVPVPIYKPKPRPPEGRATTLHDASLKYYATLKDGGNRLIDTGLPELDYSLGGGVEPGEMLVLAARPSHGKSAVALQMSHHWTLNGLPCLIVSEEMSALALGKRTVQFATQIPQEHWQTRLECLEADIEQHFSQRAPCVIVESCISAEAAAEAIRKAKNEHAIQCAVVDYAQLLKSDGKSRYEQVTNTSVCLRQVCSETQIVLVALCQLNRAIESRTKFIPQMSDLKDSGQFEQDADVIVFSVWPHRIDAERNPHEYLFFIAKNRNRPINAPAITCRFDPARQMFLEEPSKYDRAANAFGDRTV